MPLIKIEKDPQQAWGIWKIMEDESTLRLHLESGEEIPASIQHPVKRQEWYAGRVLVQGLLGVFGYPSKSLEKDEHGKPFFASSLLRVSLSHSYPYVAAIVNLVHEVGIDLEQPKDKLRRVANRVFNTEELQDAGDNIVKLCVYWCAKEAMIKIYGKKDLGLREHLLVQPFPLDSEGLLTGRIFAPDFQRDVSLQYYIEPDYVLVFNH